MGVKTEEVETCIFCRTSGRVLYPHVRDDLYGHEGDFGEMICPTCGLIWLSPRPVREDMGRFYGQYYTHASIADPPQANGQARLLGGLRDAIRTMIFCGYYGYTHLHSCHTFCVFGRVLGRLRRMRLRATNELKELVPLFTKDGLLLDIGCGRGDFLCAMRSLGWNVLGAEIDPAASALAQRRGIRVQTGPFEEADIPDNSVDHITMNHVIEHVYDPIAVMEKCRRILKPGGTVVLYAPNAKSLGHKWFQRHWLPLDPPRHLYCYSADNMRTLLKRCGFACIRLWGSTRLAPGVYDASVMLRRGLGARAQTAPLQRGRWWFSVWERASCTIGLPKGEEVVASATKPPVALRSA